MEEHNSVLRCERCIEAEVRQRASDRSPVGFVAICAPRVHTSRATHGDRKEDSRLQRKTCRNPGRAVESPPGAVGSPKPKTYEKSGTELRLSLADARAAKTPHSLQGFSPELSVVRLHGAVHCWRH